MHIEYTLTFTPRDHRHAARLLGGPSVRIMFPLLFVFFLWVGLHSSDTETPPLTFGEVVLTSAVISLGFWGALWVLIWLVAYLECWWLTNFGKQATEVTVTLDDNGVTQACAEWKTWDAWKRMKGFRESRHLFLLSCQGQHYMIPKRMLSEQQIDELREWLTRTVALSTIG